MVTDLLFSNHSELTPKARTATVTASNLFRLIERVEEAQSLRLNVVIDVEKEKVSPHREGMYRVS